MESTRRDWLRLAGYGAVSAMISERFAVGREIERNDVLRRIAKAIGEYEAQGDHRTATAVDEESGRWLKERVSRAGLTAALEPFPVDRVDPQTCTCTIAGRQIDGLPLFDADFTSAEGVRGRLGMLDSDAEIGLYIPETQQEKQRVNGAAEGRLGRARGKRRANHHRAIIAVTHGKSDGLCPSNADANWFLNPAEPPVLQVSSVEKKWLEDHARRGSEVRVVAQATRTATKAFNVTAEHQGTEPTLAPVVVMTPRSGWYACGSERGGGIACWLEIIRGVAATRTRRSVLFVASSGHELGHCGIDAYIARRAGIVKNAKAWLHLGANIGAASESTDDVLIQASPEELKKVFTEALKSVGFRVHEKNSAPKGEVKVVGSGGGQYASAICGNKLFHNIDDRGPKATSPEAVEKFSQAFLTVTRLIAGTA